MNRWDQIKATALDVAQHVTQDPIKRDLMANDLITLIGLMMDAVGKGVALEGESDMGSSYCNDPECDCAANGCRADRDKAHNRYLVGEMLQREADRAVEESRTTDLSRYDKQVWHPRCVGCGERDEHAGDCNARCPECNRIMRFGHMFCRLDPTRHNGEGAITRPAATPAVVTAEGAQCTSCNVLLKFGHMLGCVHHTWISQPECGATPDGPACDWDRDCPTHGAPFGL